MSELPVCRHGVSYEPGEPDQYGRSDWCGECWPEPPERGFEGHGDFYSADPFERYVAHQAAKGRL